MTEHFLITRFNIKTTTWKQSKDGADVLNKEWLVQRFWLFENFCFPSVQNQLNQSFKWLVFFDSGTPNMYKFQIQTFQNRYPNFIPIFIEKEEQFHPILQEEINNYISKETKKIITTRLDNDDILHQNFIATIQQLSTHQNHCIIDLTKGLQLVLSKSNKVQYYTTTSLLNPFISLVHSSSDINVYSKMHAKWTNIPIVRDHTTALWGQVIHSKNMSNRIGKTSRPAYILSLAEFGIEQALLKAVSRFRFLYSYLHFCFIRLKNIIKRTLSCLGI